MLKDMSHSEMAFTIHTKYPDNDFYVLNGNNPGAPLSPDEYYILVDETGARYAWHTPEQQWNSFQNYPVKNVNGAGKYKNKLLVGRDEPFTYVEEN